MEMVSEYEYYNDYDMVGILTYTFMDGKGVLYILVCVGDIHYDIYIF
jgi:hypothetical protein